MKLQVKNRHYLVTLIVTDGSCRIENDLADYEVEEMVPVFAEIIWASKTVLKMDERKLLASFVENLDRESCKFLEEILTERKK